MNPKGIVAGLGAAVIVAGGLFVAGQAVAQEAPVAGITPEQARAAALEAVPGSVLEVELEDEDGLNAYEVEIRSEVGGTAMEVLVDATNGTVIGTEADDDDGLFDDVGEGLFGDDEAEDEVR